MRFARIVAVVVITALAVLIADLVGAYGTLGLDQLELQLEDFRQRVTQEERHAEVADPERRSDVAIVFFDEEATADWPYWSPYPRSILAELVEALGQAGASVIGLDVYLGSLSQAGDTAADRRLAEAIDEAGNVVLVAPTVTFDTLPPDFAEPHPLFDDPARASAAADLPTSFDRATDFALVSRDGDRLRPGFAVALWALHRGIDLDSALLAWRQEGQVDLPGLPPEAGRIPDGWWTGEADLDDANVSYPIRFLGPPSHDARDADGPQTFTAYSSAEIPFLAQFSPDVLRAWFEGKVVLIGTGWHDSDRFRTVFSDYAETRIVDGEIVEVDRDAYQWTYGIEVHANALQNILDAEFFSRPSATERWIWLVGAALVVTVGVFQSSPIVGLGGLLLAWLGVVVGSFWAWTGQVGVGFGVTLFELDRAFVMLPMATLLLSPLIAYVLSSVWVALVENREKRFIQGAFGKYVSPEVVRQIAADPKALQLGGQKRTLTIFFSDLSGFTTLSERLDPQELIAHLNEYLSEMTGIVMDEQGTLDKYIGDAIMAFWNAPAPVEDHADRALRCAVLTQRKMLELNAKWLADDPEAETLVVRIGVNTGEVVVGNVGGQNRFDYSAIGDAVNLAARLEPANKAYDTLNMCSEFTLEHATPEKFRLRELDFLAVKGKTRPVKVFEVVELAGVELAPERERALALYDQGLKRYRIHRWEAAAEAFRAAVEADPSDGPSRLYLERSLENAKNPPPPDWDFVVRRNVK